MSAGSASWPSPRIRFADEEAGEAGSAKLAAVHLGIAHHLGWAVLVAAAADHVVVDRRRVELIEAGLIAAPIHHQGGTHAMHGAGVGDDTALQTLVQEVRASAVRSVSAAFGALEQDLVEPVRSLSLRAWPDDFPTDIAILRRPPFESRADSVMYLQVLAEVGAERGWQVHRYDAATVLAEAARLLGDDADQVFKRPRTELGPPWAKDHRLALAATIVAAAG